MHKHNGAPAKATAKVRHEVKVIPGDGSPPYVKHEGFLSEEKAQEVWARIQEHFVIERVPELDREDKDG